MFSPLVFLPFFGHLHNFHDRLNNKSMVKRLESPLKGFYTFHNSAHSPIFEEPEKVIKILMEDVLRWNNNNSDEI